MKTSIKTKFFLVLFGIVILFVSLTILFNTLFLKSYYTSKKEAMLTECFNYISSLTFNEHDIGKRLESLEENKNIEILIIDYRRRVFFCSKGIPDALFIPVDESGDFDIRWFREWLMPEDYESGSVEIFTSKPQLGWRYNEELAAQYLSLYAKSTKTFDNTAYPFYIIINTPMAAIEDGVEIANRFALIIGMVTILIGSIVTFFLGNQLTKPILKINQTARKISQLDFSETLAINSRDELGELAGSVNILSNELESKINELSLANEKLKEDIKVKTKIDFMRRELISNVSHDLKTPLSIILGYCEGLQANVNSDDREYYCSVIEDEAMHMSRIVSTLLKLAELESGTDSLEMSRFSLTELARDRFEKISYLIKEHSITTDFHADGDFFINADRFKIEDVLNNLLSNAIHHSPDGGHISLLLKREDDNVVCSVFNRGEHIPDDSIDLIWESFYKVDKSRTRSYGGSGLGLKIVSTILNSHGAQYHAENVDSGVCFSFRMKIESDTEINNSKDDSNE